MQLKLSYDIKLLILLVMTNEEALESALHLIINYSKSEPLMFW